MIIGKHRNIPDSSFDPQQLRRGIEVEMEHTNDPSVAKQIARDHLYEIKNYYSLLNRMEAKAMKKHSKGYSGRPVMTYDLAMAAAKDEANRNMQKHGRGKWSKEDYNVMVKTFDRLWPDPSKDKGYSGSGGFYHWPRKAPTTLRKRREVAEKGGASRCFLEPEELKFPICDVHGKIDCRGIMAAYKRARQFGHDATAKKALKRARKYRCEWVKGK